MRVAAVKIDDYQARSVETGLTMALNELGGLERFILPGDKVLIKPNMLEPVAAECAVTTHPEVVRAMIRQVHRCNAIPWVGDSPGVFSTIKVAEKCGILNVCREEKAGLVSFDQSCEYSFAEGKIVKKFQLTPILKQVDKVISLAKMKTHTFMGMTGATKNLFGCIVGVQKAQFHLRTRQRREFADMLIDLALLVKPVLSVVDGVVGMEGNGPRNGKPFHSGLLLAGDNCFAVDEVMAKIMGLEASSLPVLMAARMRGLSADPSTIEIVGDGREVQHHFIAPRSMQSLEDRVPAWIAHWATRHLTARPKIEKECIRCGRCVEHCPPGAMQLIHGQVMIDMTKCIRCYCCQELCPADAVSLERGFWLEFAGKFLK